MRVQLISLQCLCTAYRHEIWQDILGRPIAYENVKSGYQKFDHRSTLNNNVWCTYYVISFG